MLTLKFLASLLATGSPYVDTVTWFWLTWHATANFNFNVRWHRIELMFVIFNFTCIKHVMLPFSRVHATRRRLNPSLLYLVMKILPFTCNEAAAASLMRDNCRLRNVLTNFPRISLWNCQHHIPGQSICTALWKLFSIKRKDYGITSDFFHEPRALIWAFWSESTLFAYACFSRQ